jgi:hypothetical protein
MTDFEKEEFWKSLARLHDRNLELHGEIVELRTAAESLLQSTKALRDVAVAHERRLDRTEVTVEAILEDLRRHREGRA